MRIGPWRVSGLCAAVLLLAACARPAHAEEVVAAEPTAATGPHRDFVSSRNIRDVLAESRKRRTSVLDFGLRDAAIRLEDKVYRATHIRFAAIYTVLYQKASEGSGPLDAVGGDFDVLGTWAAVRRGNRTLGRLEAAFEGRHALGTEITPSALSNSFDSLWTTTSGFNTQDPSLVQIYWAQNLLNDRLHVRVGKLSGYSTFFGNRINSSSLYFVNYAFADNPAVFLPGNGAGLHVTWDFSSRWSLSAGIQNANGIKTEIDPSTLRHGELWYALQLQLKTRIHGLGHGTWRLGTWYVAAREAADTPPGAGTVLSIDQELGKKLIGFLRYEYQGENLLNPEVQYDALTGTESALRVGLGIEGPIKSLPNDYLGIAGAWGTPAGSRAKDTVVAEIFYRFQVESANQLSLSLQAIRSSTVYDQVFVLSARYRIEF